MSVGEYVQTDLAFVLSTGSISFGFREIFNVDNIMYTNINDKSKIITI